jgi:hypothetical protein
MRDSVNVARLGPGPAKVQKISAKSLPGPEDLGIMLADAHDAVARAFGSSAAESSCQDVQAAKAMDPTHLSLPP